MGTFLRLTSAACAACMLSASTSRSLQSQGSAYSDLVASYRAGEAGAVERLIRMSEDAMTDGVNRALQPGDGSLAWTWRERRAATMLHTEAWYRGLLDKRTSRADLDLALAERLMWQVTRDAPAQSEYAQRWYDVVAGLLQHGGRRGLSEEYRNRARARFPPSPARRSFLRGLAVERDGSLKGLAFASVSRGRPVESDEIHLRWWSGAARYYLDALEADAEYLPSALHLGRIRMLQGNRRQATQLFQQASRSDDGRVAYLAVLFLGSLAEREGEFEEAERRYRDGLRLYPSGQAAPIALSQILSRIGREAEARAILVALLTSGRGRLVEPLWTYLPPPQMQLGDYLAAFDELRVEVLR
jgi:tetratricopeptide (TPR) repeat protein